MSLQEIYEECSQCQKCPLGATRTKTVFGVGSEHAEIMFVGEAPGENEDLTGIPFVGRAGQLFDKYLEAVGISRDDVYIANILKCRPPKNRDPLPEEQDACINWLRAQTSFLRPKIIVCLGRIAAMKIIRPDFKITKEHGVFYEKGGILMMATLHPAALLRNPASKASAFEDYLRLREKMEELGLVAPETFPDEPCP